MNTVQRTAKHSLILAGAHMLDSLVAGPGDEVHYVAVTHNSHHQFATFDRRAVVVLPPDPELGCTIRFSDPQGSTKYFPAMIHRNGQLIMSQAEHMFCDVPFAMFALRFVGHSQGWAVIPHWAQFEEGPLS